MFNIQNLILGKRKNLFGLLLLLLVSVICAAFVIEDNNDFNGSRREILLRKLGHELLLQSGDSTSRVLPVKMISEYEYQVGFEKDLTFKPALLVNTTRRLLAKDPQAVNYVVNVLNCGSSNVTYGFAISKNKKDDIVACIGREQPKACYRINIKFKPTGNTVANNRYFLGSLPFLALVGFIFFKSGKPQRVSADNHDNEVLTLGSASFDLKNRKLIIKQKETDLTATESRLLLIFAQSPNTTIERSRLQKEIWEDEGVIVGRSLDMFISKLRKKLEPDPDINIVVIRGKGYKLETNSGKTLL